MPFVADAITARPGRAPRRRPLTSVCAERGRARLLGEHPGPEPHRAARHAQLRPQADRPLPAPAEARALEVLPQRRGPRGGVRGRTHGRPALDVERERCDQESPVRGVAACIRVVGEQQAPTRRARRAHVAWASERRVVFQERPGSLLPWPQQRARASHAGHVGAGPSAAAAGGVHEVEHSVVAQQRRSLHEAALPRGIGPEQLTGNARQGKSARRQRRRDDRRGLPAAVPILLPDEPVGAVLVGHRQWVDVPDAAAHQRPLVPVGAAQALRGGHRHAAPPAAGASGVVRQHAAIPAQQLGRPEVARGPARPPLQHRAHLAPGVGVGGAQHGEGRQPAPRCARRVPAAAGSQDRRVRVVARDHGARERGRRPRAERERGEHEKGIAAQRATPAACARPASTRPA